MKSTINKMLQIVLGVATIVLMPLSANAASATTGKYKIDPNHSTILFSANHLGFSDMTGRFNKFSGNFVLNPKGGSKVDISIQTASIDTNHDKRDKHLRGPDFFNVKQYPVMRFAATKVDFNKRGEPIKIIGMLTLHGKTKPVTLSVKFVGAGKDPWGGYRLGYNAQAIIKRSAYDIKFMPDGIGDTVKIMLNIEAIKQ